jgi:hypothetical protein
VETLDAPVYEINQDSDWYKRKMKQKEDTKNFFQVVKEKYGLVDGFGFYHSDYFGIHGNTKDYELFKGELLKNPDNGDFYPFKKRSKYYNEIKKLIEKVEVISPFTSHDVFGLNNVTASQWLGDRWFYGVKNAELIKRSEIITPIDYKDYLKVVMDSLE